MTKYAISFRRWHWIARMPWGELVNMTNTETVWSDGWITGSSGPSQAVQP
jgi:hypothetical protein